MTSKLTSKSSYWRHAWESSYTPHVRRHFLAPVGFTEIPVGYARILFSECPSHLSIPTRIILSCRQYRWQGKIFNFIENSLKEARLVIKSRLVTKPTNECPGRSESSLGAQSFCWFCHAAAKIIHENIWAASSEFGTYRLCEQRRFRRACASAQSRQNLRCSLIQAVSQEEPSDRKPDPWPLWMTGHAQSKFVMTECSKTQFRLTWPI